MGRKKKLDKVLEQQANEPKVETSTQVVVTQEDLEKMNALPEEAKAEKVLDEKQVEAQLVAEEKARLDSFLNNEEEISLMTIKLLTPKFRACVDKLPSRGLKRVLKSIVEYPLYDYTHPNDIEKNAFTLGKALTDAKLVLMYHTYNENKDKILEMALQDAAKNTVTEYGEKAEQTKEETVNG